MSLKTEAKW